MSSYSSLEPVFPHLTEAVELSLSGSGEGESITLRTEATHQAHDVFMLSVVDEVKRASAYNISSSPSLVDQRTELHTEGLPEGWESFSDQLVSAEQRVLNDEPYTEPQTLVEYEFVSPLPLLGEQGDQFTIYSVSYASSDGADVTAQMRQSSWRYPLQYKHREITSP